MPGGICFSTVWESEVTCVVAVAYIDARTEEYLHDPMPATAWLSI